MHVYVLSMLFYGMHTTYAILLLHVFCELTCVCCVVNMLFYAMIIMQVICSVLVCCAKHVYTCSFRHVYAHRTHMGHWHQTSTEEQHCVKGTSLSLLVPGAFSPSPSPSWLLPAS